MKYEGTDARGYAKSISDCDVKEGMIVLLRCKHAGLVVRHLDTYYVKFFKPYGIFTYGEMKLSPFEREFDIIAVYEKRHPSRVFDTDITSDDKLVWKALPETSREDRRIRDLELLIENSQKEILWIKAIKAKEQANMDALISGRVNGK